MSIRPKARRISRTERSPLPCLHAVSTMSRASFHVDFRTDTLLLLYYAGDGVKSCSVPYSGKPTEPVPYSGRPIFVTLQDPRPRFGKHVLGLRLSATPSDHAFRPRLSHAFQPRLSATPSGHVFRRAIRIEDGVSLSQQCVKLTNHCRTFPALFQDGSAILSLKVDKMS